jgi:uncharacterized protein with von Willebrand factor type A (vWA) domain
MMHDLNDLLERQRAARTPTDQFAEFMNSTATISPRSRPHG